MVKHTLESDTLPGIRPEKRKKLIPNEILAQSASGRSPHTEHVDSTNSQLLQDFPRAVLDQLSRQLDAYPGSDEDTAIPSTDWMAILLPLTDIQAKVDNKVKGKHTLQHIHLVLAQHLLPEEITNNKQFLAILYFYNPRMSTNLYLRWDMIFSDKQDMAKGNQLCPTENFDGSRSTSRRSTSGLRPAYSKVNLRESLDDNGNAGGALEDEQLIEKAVAESPLNLPPEISFTVANLTLRNSSPVKIQERHERVTERLRGRPSKLDDMLQVTEVEIQQ